MYDRLSPDLWAADSVVAMSHPLLTGCTNCLFKPHIKLVGVDVSWYSMTPTLSDSDQTIVYLNSLLRTADVKDIYSHPGSSRSSDIFLGHQGTHPPESWSSEIAGVCWLAFM